MVYTVTYYCGNCYYAAKVHIERGKEAPMYFECPNCGLDCFRKTKLNYVPVNEFRTKDGWHLEPVQ